MQANSKFHKCILPETSPKLLGSLALLCRMLAPSSVARVLCTFHSNVCFFFRFLSSYVKHLSLSRPDGLDEAVTLSQTVHGVVGLAHGADETAEGVDMCLAGNGTAVLVNLGNGDLDRAVILGLDDAVGSAALAGDVAVNRSRNISTPSFFLANRFWISNWYCLGVLGAVLQIDDLATVVLHLDGFVRVFGDVEVVVMRWWDSLVNS